MTKKTKPPIEVLDFVPEDELHFGHGPIARGTFLGGTLDEPGLLGFALERWLVYPRDLPLPSEEASWVVHSGPFRLVIRGAMTPSISPSGELRNAEIRGESPGLGKVILEIRPPEGP